MRHVTLSCTCRTWWLLAAPMVVTAQARVTARVQGTVIDSVAMKPLAGAVVRIVRVDAASVPTALATSLQFFAIADAVRKPFATNVSVPLQQLAVGCVGAPATHRFS